MIEEYDLNEWNVQTLRLVQALLGSISLNFRMVTLGRRGRSWSIEIVLEKESARDREEIEEIITDFDVQQCRDLEREVDVIINQNQISWPEPPTRVVYRRREVD